MHKTLILLLCCFFLGTAQAKMHDPTAPPNTTFTAATTITQDFKIQQIIVSPQKKTVIIAGHELTIGDTYMGAKVIDITAHEVKLRGKKGDFTLSIFHTIDKAPINKSGDKSEKN